MAAHFSNWRVCDVIVTSPHVIIDTSYAQSVKLMMCYERAKFHHKSVNTFRDIAPPPGSKTQKDRVNMLQEDL